jgi:hypothetical protein
MMGDWESLGSGTGSWAFITLADERSGNCCYKSNVAMAQCYDWLRRDMFVKEGSQSDKCPSSKSGYGSYSTPLLLRFNLTVGVFDIKQDEISKLCLRNGMKVQCLRAS